MELLRLTIVLGLDPLDVFKNTGSRKKKRDSLKSKIHFTTKNVQDMREYAYKVSDKKGLMI